MLVIFNLIFLKFDFLKKMIKYLYMSLYKLFFQLILGFFPIFNIIFFLFSICLLFFSDELFFLEISFDCSSLVLALPIFWLYYIRIIKLL